MMRLLLRIIYTVPDLNLRSAQQLMLESDLKKIAIYQRYNIMQKLYLFFIFDLNDNEFKKENISTENIMDHKAFH